MRKTEGGGTRRKASFFRASPKNLASKLKATTDKQRHCSLPNEHPQTTKMALEVAFRTALSAPLLSKSVTAGIPAILATRSLASIPALRAQQHRRQLHISPRTRAPNNALLGIHNNSNAPQSYFQRPRLPANTIIRFVPQQTAWVVERMGKFNRILEPGLAILIPVVERIAYVKSLKESALEIPSQSAITADNVTLDLDGVLYTRVVDAYKARCIYFSLPKAHINLC